ncbi:hypothetical protein [Dokdonella sp.]|uniref:hypothetical protein n=1 Tax=Dokdonella sp. TaxID=2291710 RepID=UPI001B0725C9|nr:hypothetical protein [Dokdonella sp.]MBO9664834.1 hypothetical protein [Dokdonella sp.]
MHLITRLIALTRSIQLRRQYREINKALEQLPQNVRRQLAAITLREFSNASKSEFPHLYATPPEDKYQAWGSGTDIGLERLRSDNLQVRLRGIALWLAVAFHETKDSPFGEQQELHRQLMRSLRTLKETIPAAELNRWMLNEAEAA